jgi:hypothetical protein
MDALLTPQRKRKSSDRQAHLASFSFDTLTGQGRADAMLGNDDFRVLRISTFPSRARQDIA